MKNASTRLSSVILSTNHNGEPLRDPYKTQPQQPGGMTNQSTRGLCDKTGQDATNSSEQNKAPLTSKAHIPKE